MKIKSWHIYTFGVVIIIVILYILSSIEPAKDQTSTNSQSEMPQDEIHKGMNSEEETPSKDNVSENIKHQMEQLKKALEENPNDTVSIKKYAAFLTAAHQPNEAIKYYSLIIEKSPNRIDILLELTFNYYNQQNYDKAEEFTVRILGIDSDRTEAHYNLGAIAAARGNKEKALKIWNNLMEKYPDSKAANLAGNAINNLP